MANSVDPDQMSQNAASDLGLHCLLRPSLQIRRVMTVLKFLELLLNFHYLFSSTQFPMFCKILYT